jgi:nucleoside-diphosphate-sugar epimerase
MVTVALTGDSGFLGAHLRSALRAEDHELRVLRRRPALTEPGIIEVLGDLDHEAALVDLVDGADAIVHAAGLVRSSDAAALRHVNVDGTRTLLAASLGVRCFVQISTAGVYGTPGGRVTEHSPLDPPNPYERSKAEADHEVERMRPDRATLVRPTNVLGVGHPHDPLVRFLRRVAAGTLVAPASARTNYVSATAVAAVVARLVSCPGPPPILLVNEGMSVTSLAAMAADALGVPDRTRRLPVAVARPMGAVLAVGASRIVGLRRARMLFDTTTVESVGPASLQPARDSLRRTLEAMVADYRVRGLL